MTYAMRYFYAENATRPVIVSRTRCYRFRIVWQGGGTSAGVVAVPEEDAAEFIAIGGKRLVELSQADYERYGAAGGAPRVAAPQLHLSARAPQMKGERPAEVVDGASIPRASGETRLAESLDEAIDLGTAAPPMPETPGKARKTRRKA